MPHDYLARSGSRTMVNALLCLIVGMTMKEVPAWAGSVAPGEGQDAPASMPDGNMAHMAHMSGHMYMTELRAPQPGDQKKADALVVAAKAAMAPYQDYRKALADGFKIFLPNVPQAQYHFTNYRYALAARSHFDPLKPTSLQQVYR
jgi:hypothetical protein